MLLYIQKISVNRNSRELKAQIEKFLRNEWNWNDEDFSDGMSETHYSISFEFINDNTDELNQDISDFEKFLNSILKTGKVSKGKIVTKNY